MMRNVSRNILFLFILVFNELALGSVDFKADLIIFSYDRPLQLYALLESIEQYVSGIDSKVIIYRTSNDSYEQAYEEVKKRFPLPDYQKQSNLPQLDFKRMTVQAFRNSKTPYILFAVDDIIIKDCIDIAQCIQLIEKNNAYGFYPWLGKNISECYSLNSRAQPAPQMAAVESGIFAWRFSNGTCDWNYPHTVDFALYRKKDIVHFIENLEYSSPNTLEGIWAGQSHYIQNKIGLCFEFSKSVNLPLNRVGEFKNRHMNFMSPEQMLELFEQNLKIDIKPLFRIKNKDPHMVYMPTFVERN
jgi:hypothetical protein